MTSKTTNKFSPEVRSRAVRLLSNKRLQYVSLDHRRLQCHLNECVVERDGLIEQSAKTDCAVAADKPGFDKFSGCLAPLFSTSDLMVH